MRQAVVNKLDPLDYASTEALNTVCRNASWIVVTSQSNVSDVVGEMNSNQGNDFSRIIGRFSTKIQLSSKNVGEVIRARLLEKNADGQFLLDDNGEKIPIPRTIRKTNCPEQSTQRQGRRCSAGRA